MECKHLPPLASTAERTAAASDFEPINASCNLGSMLEVLLKAAIAELAAKELSVPEMATRTSALPAGAIIRWMLETIGESKPALPIRADAIAPEMLLSAAETQTKLNFCCSNKIAADLDAGSCEGTNRQDQKNNVQVALLYSWHPESRSLGAQTGERCDADVTRPPLPSGRPAYFNRAISAHTSMIASAGHCMGMKKK